MSEHDTTKSESDTPGEQDAVSGPEILSGPEASSSPDAVGGFDAASSADAVSGTDAVSGMDFLSYIGTIVEFFQTGGAFMYPILIVFSLGLAISIERYIKLTYARKVNRTMWNKLQPVLAEADFNTAREMVINDQKSTISKLMAMALERQGTVRRRDDIEIAMEESMMEIIPQLEKRTPYIALFANICTLLGLLGTIMGLIAAFTAVANANPAEKADLLSASISVAMNTTAFGLMAGIPLLIFHAFLTSRTGDIVDSLEMASVKTLNIITSTTERKRDAYKGPPEITITNLTSDDISEAALSGDLSAGVDADKAEKPD